MNETLGTVDGRSIIRMERHLRHPPDKVWRALTEPAQIARWFPAEMDLDLRPGAKIRFTFSGDQSPASDGEVLEVDPPRVFAYAWEDELLRWELRPDATGSLLVFTHTFDDRPGAATFASGWQACIDALDAVLDGRSPEVPPGWQGLHDAHEAFVAAFGLDEGTVEGRRVGFERQLTRPVDEVWARLTGDEVAAVGAPPPAGFTTDEIPAGEVTAVDPPALLAYQVPGGQVRWELSEGPGEAARLVLTHADADDPAGALAAWRSRIARLAADLRP
jgi:uncharacterized protein YndB with AHSA1/START domain